MNVRSPCRSVFVFLLFDNPWTVRCELIMMSSRAFLCWAARDIMAFCLARGDADNQIRCLGPEPARRKAYIRGVEINFASWLVTGSSPAIASTFDYTHFRIYLKLGCSRHPDSRWRPHTRFKCLILFYFGFGVFVSETNQGWPLPHVWALNSYYLDEHVPGVIVFNMQLQFFAGVLFLWYVLLVSTSVSPSGMCHTCHQFQHWGAAINPWRRPGWRTLKTSGGVSLLLNFHTYCCFTFLGIASACGLWPAFFPSGYLVASFVRCILEIHSIPHHLQQQTGPTPHACPLLDRSSFFHLRLCLQYAEADSQLLFHSLIVHTWLLGMMIEKGPGLFQQISFLTS